MMDVELRVYKMITEGQPILYAVEMGKSRQFQALSGLNFSDARAVSSSIGRACRRAFDFAVSRGVYDTVPIEDMFVPEIPNYRRYDKDASYETLSETEIEDFSTKYRKLIELFQISEREEFEKYFEELNSRL